MMEKIVTLFEDFRENNLSYDDLYNTLLSKIQQDPSFRHQAIPTLDQVQKRTPIPITHFIQLRSELDSAIENFTPTETQQTSVPSVDPDATLITALPDEHSRPNNINLDEDATALNFSATTQNTTNNNYSTSAPTLLAKPSADTTDDENEATMIMPTGTLSAPPLSNTSTPPTIDSEDETVVNLQTSLTATEEPALAETLVGKTYKQSDNKNLDEAETLVGTPTNGATPDPTIPPPPPTPELTTSPVKPSFPSVWIWGGTATFIVLCSVIIAITNNAFEPTSNPEIASPKQTEPASEQDNNSWGAAPGILQPTPDAKPAQQSSVTDTPLISSELETADSIATTSTTSVQPTELFPQITDEAESTNPPAEKSTAVITPIIKEQSFESKEDEISYFVGQIKNAINANNLAPAEKVGTATYYLVKLVKASPNTPFASQARSQIAKAHLALAAIARNGERWDEAQQHLDDAFTVRLPDSYQSQ
ncbi:hypothetical protein A9Q81_05695 [Gammaproteobacteria bacterium 42_54_T18]|nr:hypothetical protein A9Q81_05695 [Gammaproteobacteria bacterium 42_54_T18]